MAEQHNLPRHAAAWGNIPIVRSCHQPDLHPGDLVQRRSRQHGSALALEQRAFLTWRLVDLGGPVDVRPGHFG